MHAGLSISLHPPTTPTENEDIEKFGLFHPAVDSTPQLLDSTSLARAQASVESFAQGHKVDAVPGKGVSVCTFGNGQRDTRQI